MTLIASCKDRFAGRRWGTQVRGDRYRWPQIAVHWLIVASVVVQYGTSGSIRRTHGIEHADAPAATWDLFLHAVHNRLGLVIFVLVAIRLALRLRHGRPAHPDALPVWRGRLSGAVHAAFYAILAGQAATGAIASYVWWPMAGVHRALFVALLVTIALHLAGVAASLAADWRTTIWRITGIDLSASTPPDSASG